MAIADGVRNFTGHRRSLPEQMQSAAEKAGESPSGLGTEEGNGFPFYDPGSNQILCLHDSLTKSFVTEGKTGFVFTPIPLE